VVDPPAEPNGAAPATEAAAVEQPWRPPGLWGLFLLFLRAGMNFGGGLAIMAILSRELVDRRRAMSRREFLTLYALSRIVPAGTMSGMAVAIGYRFAGLLGTLAALAGVALPGLLPTLALVVLYDRFRGSPAFDLLPVTLLPAAVALIGGAVISLAREVARPVEIALAALGLIGALFFRIDPAVLIVLGGAVGAALLRGEAKS
jgi:chromate transporter